MPRSQLLGPHRQRPEEPDTAPVREEIRADELAVQHGCEGRCRVGPPASSHEVGIAEELLRLRRSHEGAERSAKDQVGLVEVALGKRPDDHVAASG